MTTIEDEIQNRIEAGDFGNPPNMSAVIKATEELTKKQKGALIAISGLWPGKGKVAYEGRTQEDLNIPKGSKILMFTNNKEHDGQPDYNLVYVQD